MANETLRYYATDKEIFDVLASSEKRVNQASLLEIARERGIYYSPHEARETLASSISLLPHDYDSLRDLLGQSENPNRAERVTSITLNATLTVDAVKKVVDIFRVTAPPDEKVIGRTESPDKYAVQVKYSELDYGRTRLLQRRVREADFRFIVEGNKTTIRMPANSKARAIAEAFKAGLDASEKTDIPTESIEITDLAPDSRTLFFTSLISTMKGYDLQDVMNVKVQSGDKSKPELSADEEDDATEDEVTVSEQMLSVVENVALNGKALLATAEYQLLKEKGFYITSITWKSKQTDSPFNIVEFDAGFEEPKEGKGFRYNVRGLYRNNDGQFTRTIRSLTAEQKELIYPLLEETALTTVAELRKNAGTITAPQTDSGIKPPSESQS